MPRVDYTVQVINRQYHSEPLTSAKTVPALAFLAEIEDSTGHSDLASRLFSYVIQKKKDLTLSHQLPESVQIQQVPEFHLEPVEMKQTIDSSKPPYSLSRQRYYSHRGTR